MARPSRPTRSRATRLGLELGLALRLVGVENFLVC